ncbi:hypothetical protein F5148DRAFT_276927 [Russula earlei]|uniref:Uncharacterized protein n=1 Tax=Russula earlei TaxID=71964 RepID=A0ACC0UNU0_9AGAM|nr:hypothetical protein F5148DRAFT_276927 [Russula earlei]
MLRVLSVRCAARSQILSRTPRYLPVRRHTPRTFSTTPRRPAAEAPDDFMKALEHTPLFQKLADKPEAIKALIDLYSLTKEMGLDINAPATPSQIQYRMLKLMVNLRFVRAVKRVMVELNAAGLKLNSEALQELMSMTQKIPKAPREKDKKDHP